MTHRPPPLRPPAETATLRDRAQYWYACAAQAPTAAAAAACRTLARQHRTYCPSI